MIKPLQDVLRSKTISPTAAICELFDLFVYNCQSAYSLGEKFCVDEMLIPFHGRGNFKVFMSKKPNKYELKIQILTDARTGYFSNNYLHCGKGKDSFGLSIVEKKLTY